MLLFTLGLDTIQSYWIYLDLRLDSSLDLLLDRYFCHFQNMVSIRVVTVEGWIKDLDQKREWIEYEESAGRLNCIRCKMCVVSMHS